MRFSESSTFENGRESMDSGPFPTSYQALSLNQGYGTESGTSGHLHVIILKLTHAADTLANARVESHDNTEMYQINTLHNFNLHNVNYISITRQESCLVKGNA